MAGEASPVSEAEIRRLHTEGFGGVTIPCYCPVCAPELHAK
jgi:hypothetical protein